MNFQDFEKQIGIQFNNHQLLKQAFTHSSYVNEHPLIDKLNNERLEFLGDAVLELGVSQYLYQEFQQMSEGELTKLRAAIVCEEALVYFAKELKMEKYILLGKGEELTGGRNRPSLLADVFESFLGALYLDQGFEKVLDFLEKYIFPKIDTGAFSHVMDYKTQLQEFVQAYKDSSIEYTIIDERGPSHQKEFIAQVQVGKKTFKVGVGRTKKEAEQQAAKHAIEAFQEKFDEQKF